MSSSIFARALRTDFTATIASGQALRWHKKGKINEATVLARKERKRLKLVNVFSGDYTGERPPHPWLNAKRLKALVTAHQNLTNKNRHNVPIEPKDKIAMKKEFDEIGAYEYFNMRCQQIESLKNQEIVDQTAAELDTLPFAISEEMKKMPIDKRLAYASDAHSPYILYFEQIARMFDEEHLTKLKVSQRLQRLAEDKLGEND